MPRFVYYMESKDRETVRIVESIFLGLLAGIFLFFLELVLYTCIAKNGISFLLYLLVCIALIWGWDIILLKLACNLLLSEIPAGILQVVLAFVYTYTVSLNTPAQQELLFYLALPMVITLLVNSLRLFLKKKQWEKENDEQ